MLTLLGSEALLPSRSLVVDTALDAQSQQELRFVPGTTLRAGSGGRYHLSSVEQERLLDLRVAPLLARLVHHKVVLEQPRSQDLLVQHCHKSRPVSIRQHLVQLLLVLPQLSSLLGYKRLNSLLYNGPVGEWDLRDGVGIHREVHRAEVVVRQQSVAL